MLEGLGVSEKGVSSRGEAVKAGFNVMPKSRSKLVCIAPNAEEEDWGASDGLIEVSKELEEGSLAGFEVPSVGGAVATEAESSLAGSEGSVVGLGVCVERLEVGSEGESWDEFAPELFRPEPPVDGFDSMEEAGGVLGNPSSFVDVSFGEEDEPESLSFDFFFFPTIESHCFSKLPKLE